MKSKNFNSPILPDEVLGRQTGRLVRIHARNSDQDWDEMAEPGTQPFLSVTVFYCRCQWRGCVLRTTLHSLRGRFDPHSLDHSELLLQDKEGDLIDITEVLGIRQYLNQKIEHNFCL